MRLSFAPYLLHFKEPGGTSRGVMTEKPTFFIKVFEEDEPEKFGIGEAAIFPGLSPEADGNYVNKLIELMANVALGIPTDLSHHSSIQFGLEQAILDYSNNCNGIYFPSTFTEGYETIEINGLIWMGDFKSMMDRIGEKLDQGFHCLKLKIGAIRWEEEIKMIEEIRKEYSADKLMIRVDANGSFSPSEALEKLYQLSQYEIHSIEQPIKAGNPAFMKKICSESPLPIALDEELIGKGNLEEKVRVAEEIRPSYLILKPALCGGFSGANEWIEIAESHEIGWWITSALESNVGLNAIAQWTATKGVNTPQGLGTGGVFTDNFHTPLYLKAYRLQYDPSKIFDYSQFENLRWH